MISFAQFKSTIIEGAKRVAKVVQFGPKTAVQASSFGEDARPLADTVAIYAKTTEKGEAVIIGYINKNQLGSLGEGEKRVFSLRPDGSQSFAVHLKNDGTCEIGGANHNLVRFTPLKVGLENQDSAINQELAKIATAISTLGGSYVPETIQTNVDSARIDEVKSL